MESDEPAVYCSLDTFPKFNTVEEMLQFDKSMGVATTLPPVVTTVTRTPSWLFRQTFSSDPVPKDPLLSINISITHSISRNACG
ncbi:hypothetical protein [Waltera sp.]|uniref:hypothetical protein n=1 Tax=Waltera sp. TaxID=2815806 RepID=UPI0039A087A2